MTQKIIAFQIPKPSKEFVRFQVDEDRHFYDKLHQHPEWQLTLILEGKGQLMVGDYVGRFEPGDVFLFTSNMPHVFRSDSEYFEISSEKQSLGHTLFFDFEALGKSFLEVEEFSVLIQWLHHTKGSYAIQGETKLQISKALSGFGKMEGLDKLLHAFNILKVLQQREDLLLLNRLILQKDYTETEGKRMGQVMSFILSESQRNIQLKEVADVANMSKEAFCRFFKERTGKTFTEFLNKLRISKACHTLQNTDLSISQTAFQTGFQNLSHFNRAYKKYTHQTPKSFRKQFQF